MRAFIVALFLIGLLVKIPSGLAQQTETGPAAPGANPHPLRTEETGARGPSGGSPETGPHGQRDVTKDAEPGKKKPTQELQQSGQKADPTQVKPN